jgi:hypothetical protein
VTCHVSFLVSARRDYKKTKLINESRKAQYPSSGEKSYIQDPPEVLVNSSNEEINTNNQTEKKLTLLDLLINPFSYFFKK